MGAGGASEAETPPSCASKQRSAKVKNSRSGVTEPEDANSGSVVTELEDDCREGTGGTADALLEREEGAQGVWVQVGGVRAERDEVERWGVAAAMRRMSSKVTASNSCRK